MAVLDNVVNGDGEDILDDKYFEDLLNDEDEPEVPKVEEKPKLTEEQLRKNKNAEEARKRREAEAKAVKTETVAPTEEAKKPAEPIVEPASEKPADPKVEQVNKLGEQLVQFKQKYPDVDLAKLDGDKAFKRFIDGRVLGKKDFTTLYEEYQEFRSEMGVTVQQQNNQIKSQAATGSSVSSVADVNDVFSEDELRKLSERLPFMNPKEASKIDGKLQRSIRYYEKK
jgi:hypothetical protein